MKYNTSQYDTPYKFNGKEKDEETGYNNFGARYYYDWASIWLSVDPMSDKYPSLTSYNYCANNPVMLIDPDGREIWIIGDDGNSYQYKGGNLYTIDGKRYKGDDKFANRVKNDINTLKKNGQRSIIKSLEKSKNIHSIKGTKGDNSSTAENSDNAKNGVGTGSTILYNTEKTESRDGKRPPIIRLAHEIGHSNDYNEGKDNSKSPFTTMPWEQGIPWAEINAVADENVVRMNMGIPLRRTFQGISIDKFLPESQQYKPPAIPEHIMKSIEFSKQLKR